MKKNIMIIITLISTTLYPNSFEQNGVKEGNSRLSIGIYGEKEYKDNESELNIKLEGSYGKFITDNSEILLKVRDTTDLNYHKYKIDTAYSFYFSKHPIFTPYIGVELGISGDTQTSNDKIFNEQGLFIGFHQFFTENISLTPEVGIEFTNFNEMTENYFSLYLSYFFD
jgi:hypothetical protein